jgi:hypothetical protein
LREVRERWFYTEWPSNLSHGNISSEPRISSGFAFGGSLLPFKSRIASYFPLVYQLGFCALSNLVASHSVPAFAINGSLDYYSKVMVYGWVHGPLMADFVAPHVK